MTKQIINKTVTITAVGFKKNVTAYPRRMEYDGREYQFVDAGLRCVIRKGGCFSQILTLSDGEQQFRLKSDGKNGLWTLLSIYG